MTTICESPVTVASQQKLSALMRQGSTLRPEYREAYAGIVMKDNDLSSITIGTCPLGAAYEAATGMLPHDEMEQVELYEALRRVTGIDLSRECLQLQKVNGDQLLPEKCRAVRLDQFINHLSLDLGWSRERIADFLEAADY